MVHTARPIWAFRPERMARTHGPKNGRERTPEWPDWPDRFSHPAYRNPVPQAMVPAFPALFRGHIDVTGWRRHGPAALLPAYP